MITSEEMKELEEAAEQCGITRLELMENAGRKVAEAIEDKYKDKIKEKKVLVICGSGNNGGDGFVVARYLYDVCKVEVLFLGEKSRLPNEASLNYDHLREVDETILFEYNEDTAMSLNMNKYDVIVDAMLGTGIKGELLHPYSTIVRDINNSKAFVVSVDIPSGLDPDNEKKQEVLHVDPGLIVTFHDIKPVLKHFKKITKIADIGIPF